MTHADINDLPTRDYIFKIGDREKGIQARYDENTDAIIFPRAVFDYVYKLLKEALSQEPCDDAISRDIAIKHLTKARMIGDSRPMTEIFAEIPSVTQKPNFCASCKHNTDNEICLECEYDGITRGMTRYESVTQKSETVTEFADRCRECGARYGKLLKQKLGKWIPVSKRLPEDKTYVLTTIKVPNRIAHARSSWYEGGFFHNDNGDTWRTTDMEVKAWMPLPKPFEPQESEDKE